MRAYVQDVAPFHGPAAPVRRALSRAVVQGTPRPAGTGCAAVGLRCRRLPERKYHCFAVDRPRRRAGRRSSAFLPVARQLVTTVSWWDTADPIAARAVGALVAADPAPRDDVGARTEDDDR
ncbi:hypothetical protein GCM10020295_71210 [Streptomyces cinereospinus]